MGLNPAQWRDVTGSIAIVRRDLKPLHCAHVDALYEYCSRNGFSQAQLNHLPVAHDANGVDLTPFMDLHYQASSQQLLNNASKEDFEEFFDHFMQTVGAEKYGNIASPYNV
jgi:hypothetical protein